jgi:hypothetical protein
MSVEQPFRLALTLDVDPDANRAVRGRRDAVTAHDPNGEAHCEATFGGLTALADLLETRQLQATLFWEGRTLLQLAESAPALLSRLIANSLLEHGCHGHRHEDFAGVDSGMPFSGAEIRAALLSAGNAFESVFGVRPRAFRAPYCRLTPTLVKVLHESGYLFDASQTRDVAHPQALQPHRLPDSRLWELPLCRARDQRGKPISGYLWQLCEGKRPVSDYVYMVESVRRACPSGLIQLAIHPWHLIVSDSNQPFRGAGHSPVELLGELLDRLLAGQGRIFATVGGYLARTGGADAAGSEG